MTLGTRVTVALYLCLTSSLLSCGQLPTSKLNATQTEVTYQFETILREFGTYQGAPDRGVLLIVKPSEGNLVINRVTGPKTAQPAYVGNLEKIMARFPIFGASNRPMTDTLRRQILAKYTGSTALYIEHYENQLCDTQVKSFALAGKLDEIPITAHFSFQALSQPNDACILVTSANTVTY